MKKMKKILRTVLPLVLIGFLAIGAVYVLAATVTPVRAMLHDIVEGTVFEHFLPHHDCDDDCDHHHSHDDCDHDCDHHGEGNEIALSPTASRTIGIDDSTIMTVEVTDFYRSLTFPAIVVERPGFSRITVPSPVSGVVTRIYHETGVAVSPGEPLFDILLNQQELVRTQTDFLALLTRRAINTAELQRLAGIDPQIVPRQLRDLENERMQIDSEIDILKNLLLLQGLSENDVLESLMQNGTIIRTMTVYAPAFVIEANVASTAHADQEEHAFILDELYVTAGRNVAVGDSLGRLSDYCKLAIKGKVFAANERMLAHALASRARVTATFAGNGSREIIDGLFLRSIDNRIDPISGTLFCYVDLPNRFTAYEVGSETNLRRYKKWHFKPGQRCELHVEYEPLPNVIVLPIGAIVRDLNEMIVFEWVDNAGDSRIWRKTPVHVLYQTKDVVAIANDGALHPGDKVATRGANFLLAALNAQQNVGGMEIQTCNDGCH